MRNDSNESAGGRRCPESIVRSTGIQIAPSLLSADFARLREHIGIVEKAGVEVLHLDVMDGHFVPNISFGVPVIASLRKSTDLFFDAHLMIDDPMGYAEAFVKAGCDLITFHAEAPGTKDAPMEMAKMVKHIHDLGVFAGVSLNPTTEMSAIEEIIDEVDLVLVMSVWPGFGGQKFIGDVLPKVRQLRERMGEHQRLEIDGGIDSATISSAVEAGADWLVAGSAVFGQNDAAAAASLLDSLGKRAAAGGNGD